MMDLKLLFVIIFVICTTSSQDLNVEAMSLDVAAIENSPHDNEFWLQQVENLTSMLNSSDKHYGRVYLQNPRQTTLPVFSSDCNCGHKYVHRIVGGEETALHEYPWQVALINSNSLQLFCGGSVLNDRYVLTAAHCVKYKDKNSILIFFRDHDVSTTSETNHIVRKVKKIIVHARYDDYLLVNDIALLKLATPVTMSPLVSPVCLPNHVETQYVNRQATVTGWGVLHEQDGHISDVLMAVNVTIISNNRCNNKTDYEPSQIYDEMMCATAPGKDSCNGDSGGPLVVRDFRGNYDQVGIVSFGYGCARPTYPGVYTRVTKYLKWIKRNTLDGVYCHGFQFP